MRKMKFEIFKDKQGKYRWRLISLKKAIAQSVIGYSRRAGCVKAIMAINVPATIEDYRRLTGYRSGH